MSIYVDVPRELEEGGFRYLENGILRILEEGIEMETGVTGTPFVIEDVMDYMSIPYGYARTLMVRLFDLPQNLEFLGKTIVIGKDDDLYKQLQTMNVIKSTMYTDEYLPKEAILEYIKVSSKHIINLDPWVK